MTTPTSVGPSWNTYKQLAGSRLAASGVQRPPKVVCSSVHKAFWLRASKIARQHSCLRRNALAQAEPDTESTASEGVALADLLVVGPGVLGGRLGQLWLQHCPSALVSGQTNTSNHHERLRQLGLTPRVKSEADSRRYPNVAFCAPPSGSDDYAGEVESALQQWDRSGTFLFTSSIGVYPEDSSSTCTEQSPTMQLGTSARQDRLLKAEEAVLAAGGNVVRLAGLYHAHRGAHTAFLRMKQVERPGDYAVNLLHYEDAASLCLAVLQHPSHEEPLQGQIYLGCDGCPVSFQGMMDATLACPKFEGQLQVSFTGATGGGLGKRLDNAATQAALCWQPKYPSFKQFMADGGVDVYSLEDAWDA